MRVVNDSNYDVTCDGKTYSPGQSFNVPNVLAILKADDHSQLRQSAIWEQYNEYSGGGYLVSDIFTIGSGGIGTRTGSDYI